jgi:two-component system CheB/CheR fusion protein
VGSRYIFPAELRRSIIFGRHDLMQDAPISRLDLLVCRNTLMYFNAEAQSKLLARFHFALNETGFLFLGKAEMLLTHSNVFSPLDLKHRVFVRAPQVDLRDRLLVLAQTGGACAKPLSRLDRWRRSWSISTAI